MTRHIFMTRFSFSYVDVGKTIAAKRNRLNVAARKFLGCPGMENPFSFNLVHLERFGLAPRQPMISHT
jgi:hypothetical protein